MVDELVAMEEKIGENLEQQALHLQEIDSLREKIQQFERESEIKTRQQVKGVDAAKKRFNTLYKRITRARSGN
jgi:demethoxyubiquinone hydroxylase (CLK1/Coq7/Cat5 family)